MILVNNRKLAEGFFLGAGATDAAAALRAIDKLDKIGPAKVAALLESEAGLSAEGAQRVPGAGRDPQPRTRRFVEQVRALGVEHPLLDEGLAELAARRRRRPPHAMPGALVADLKIARGLDYYTGTVYETQLVGYESFGSVCSGRPLRRARQRRPHHLPRRRHLPRRQPAHGRRSSAAGS